MKKSFFLFLILAITLKSFSQNVKVFSSVSVLKTASGLLLGDTVRTLGYYKVGDGGAADYAIMSNGTGISDGGLLIQLNTYMAKLIYSDPVNVKCFGANPDAHFVGANVVGTDNTKAIQMAINTGMNVFVPRGDYIVTTLNLKSRQSLFGESSFSRLRVNATQNAPLINISFDGINNTEKPFRCTVKDLQLEYTPITNSNCCAITIDNGNYCFIEKLSISGRFKNAISLNNNYTATVKDCYIYGTVGNSINLEGGTGVVIENNVIQKCDGEAFIYLKNSPSAHLIHNYIAGNDSDRPLAGGIYAQVDTTTHGLGCIFIESNDIDDIAGRGIVVNGYLSVVVRDNWISAGRGCKGNNIKDAAGNVTYNRCTGNPTTSVYLESCKRVEFIGNNIYTSSDNGLHMINCEYGSICNNVIEFCPNTGLYMINCRFMAITNNQIGNLTYYPGYYGGLMKCGISDNIGTANVKTEKLPFYEGGYNIIKNNVVSNYVPPTNGNYTAIYHDAINDIVADNITFGTNNLVQFVKNSEVPYKPNFRTSHISSWQAR